MSAAYIQVHFRLDFFIEANNMNFDQTAPLEQPDLGSYYIPINDTCFELFSGYLIQKAGSTN